MKNITLSADAALIAAARARARAEHTTLNEQFREWLTQYAHDGGRVERCDDTLRRLRGQLKVGSTLTRDQRNER